MMKSENISVLDIFKIGVGPSSSHTLGPWRAAQAFLKQLRADHNGVTVKEIYVDLFGSLAKTGRGHGTDLAAMLGLAGYDPVTIDTTLIGNIIEKIKTDKSLRVDGQTPIVFLPSEHIRFHFSKTLPYHPNGIRFSACLEDGSDYTDTWYSIGGGFITKGNEQINSSESPVQLPYPVTTADDLLKHCSHTGLSISEVVRKNEASWRADEHTLQEVRTIWQTMLACLNRGCRTSGGFLPGELRVKRRAGVIHNRLLSDRAPEDAQEWIQKIRKSGSGFSYTLDWLSCFALAVNEENASFGRVVTAPTNGSAGVIPAVLMYHIVFCDGNTEEQIFRFLLTAAEVGSIFKKGATLSAAMGGCQAEIGVSSAMAAAGLTEVMGGTPEQCLMAAEIAMEHHLGLTCDPVAGLVQIPCIERNAMGAVKAVTASQLALQGDPISARVSLDDAVRTMWQTAQDMNEKYKETSEGGLAVNIPVALSEC